MVGILLMRGRRLRGSLFYICYAFGVRKWDRVGGDFEKNHPNG
jgi:hypothetical protein